MVALEGMQCFGGNGYINGNSKWHISEGYFEHLHVDYPLGRIVRDSRLYAVGAGTQEIRRMLIGREFNQELSDK